jgi:hypothetical protein
MSYEVPIWAATLEEAKKIAKKFGELPYVLGTLIQRIGERLPPRTTRRKPSSLRPMGTVWLPAALRSLLEFKLDNVIVVSGTKEAGVNIKLNNASVVSGGIGTITIKQDNA